MELNLNSIAFWSFSSLAVLSALGAIFFRNLVYTVLSLISVLIMISGLFFTLGAELVGALQLLIYAVAIVVFYVLVISTVPQFKGKAIDPKYMLLSIPIGFLIFLELAYVSVYGAWKSNTGIFSPEIVEKIGNAKAVSTMLFTKYLFPFEVASLILLVAMIGAIVIGKKQEQED
ncbi:NADH-quinone oxidoreductase subunit J family protein [Hydrogenothermus marinus]|uniref:NADH-quinone oxidoreductase subunit J n=1 Tax=Hydrogenothermus marinus TaxID=133270 RepID=A0A3M0BNL3_9AQUI|nr:NADH-quinone oxidoreductase subunit J [Hydrogenothermus marinus]RMA97879.1 NADH-quinone oxidoreductase subunit J [Hydrogenothermus marinus]